MAKPQCTSKNIALTIDLPGLEQGEPPIIQYQTQNRQEAKYLVQEQEHSVSQSSKLFTLKFDLQFECHKQIHWTVRVEVEPCIEDHPLHGIISTPPSISNVNIRTVENELIMKPKEISIHVEQALRDFHSVARLSKNPLNQLVNLDAYQSQDENVIQMPGIALQQFLDQLITAVSGMSAGQKLSRSQWRLEHYLHLRYREGIQHKDLASYLGYTERHLLRLRRELVLEVAELIIEQSR